MAFENCYAGIDGLVVQLVTHRARQLAAQLGFDSCERQNLEQELMDAVMVRLKHYDPERANRKTFISLAMRQAAATFVKLYKAKKRKSERHVLSLDEPLQNRQGEGYTLGETISHDDYLLATGRISSPQAELDELGIDVRRVIAGLPDDLRELCERLATSSVTEICRETGLSQWKIKASISKLRQAFSEAGLHDYL